jgi:hypothetical protein
LNITPEYIVKTDWHVALDESGQTIIPKADTFVDAACPFFTGTTTDSLRDDRFYAKVRVTFGTVPMTDEKSDEIMGYRFYKTLDTVENRVSLCRSILCEQALTMIVSLVTARPQN